MTNKEKADKISEHYSTSRYLPNDKEIAAYNAAIQMAEWKDQQFAKEKKKFIEYLESALQGGVHPQGTISFVKQFKQIMEESL